MERDSSSNLQSREQGSDLEMIVGVAKTIASSVTAAGTPRKIKTSTTYLAMQESVKEKAVSTYHVVVSIQMSNF